MQLANENRKMKILNILKKDERLFTVAEEIDECMKRKIADQINPQKNEE